MDSETAVVEGSGAVEAVVDRASDGLYTLGSWSRPGETVAVYDLATREAWDALACKYAFEGNDEPLQRVFEIARSHGVVSVVIEFRYIDGDWRSQLGRFFNGTFRRYPSVCHRVHFFTKPILNDLSNLDESQDDYRGYTVLRPFPISPVGRTMIVRPVELEDAVAVEVNETVDLIGRSLTVRSMPFISQDTQFLRCAHAAMWMVLAHAAMVEGSVRPLPGEIHDAAVGGEKVGRQLPNGGLSGSQLWGALETLGLSPNRRLLPQTREAEESSGPVRLYTLMRRYVNSSLPPIITSYSHAWVVVAYKREPSAGDPELTLWRHDDARGPYIRVDDPWAEPEDGHSPWELAYLPLPRKAYVDAERASSVARYWIRAFQENRAYSVPALTQASERENSQHRHTFRTYLVRSTVFKFGLEYRAVPVALAEAYRRAPMSKYVWIVEIVDGLRREKSQPDVMGEIVIDATVTQHEPIEDPAGMLAVHIDDIAFIPGVDGAKDRIVELSSGEFYETGCPAMSR